jgi:hypothetical protein
MSSLQHCDLWHPGIPSEWSDYQRKKAGVVIGVRRICLECNRARCRAHHHGLPYPQAPVNEQVPPEYGVLPRLNWAPPSI